MKKYQNMFAIYKGVEGLNFKWNSTTAYKEFAAISEIIIPTMHIYL